MLATGDRGGVDEYGFGSHEQAALCARAWAFLGFDRMGCAGERVYASVVGYYEYDHRPAIQKSSHSSQKVKPDA
jgi:hypothetical protein